MVLYNVCHAPGNIKSPVIRLLSVYRFRLLEGKLRINPINRPIHNVPFFIQSLTDAITSETKHLFDDEEFFQQAVT